MGKKWKRTWNWTPENMFFKMVNSNTFLNKIYRYNRKGSLNMPVSKCRKKGRLSLRLLEKLKLPRTCAEAIMLSQRKHLISLWWLFWLIYRLIIVELCIGRMASLIFSALNGTGLDPVLSAVSATKSFRYTHREKETGRLL